MTTTPWMFARFQKSVRENALPLDVAFMCAAAWALSLWLSTVAAISAWSLPLFCVVLSLTSWPLARAAPGRPQAWWTFGAAFFVAFDAQLRIAMTRAETPGAIACASFSTACCAGVVVFPLVSKLGRAVDGRGEVPGRWALHASRGIMALALLSLVAATARVPGRVDAMQFDDTGGSVALGTFVTLGGRCPPSCDVGRDGRSLPSTAILLHGGQDDAPVLALDGGFSLERSRVDAFTTRFKVTHNGRVLWSRTAVGGQRVQLSRDRRGRFLRIEHHHHPTTLVRVADGTTLTAHSWDAELREFAHAPTSYLVAAAMGLALAIFALMQARSVRAFEASSSTWRDATLRDDGRLYCGDGLAPTLPPEGDHPTGSIVVLRGDAPHGAAFRSDHVLQVHEVTPGTVAELQDAALGLAYTWELAALVTTLVTSAPLFAMGITGWGW